MKTRITVCAAVAAAASYAHAAELQLAMTDPVVVTATRFPERLGDRPVNMTVITAEDIRASTAKTVPDILAQQAGIAIQDYFGNNAATTTVDLRGFGATGTQNTLILVDGRPVVDLDMSGVQWSAIPLGAIDRIEILRGGGSVLYGGGATAGVINIITVSPANRPRGVDVLARAGSYGAREAQVSATTASDRAAVSFHASNLESNGYRSNNQNRQSTGLADMRWFTPSGEISLKLGTDNQGIRLPGERRVRPATGLNELENDRRGTSKPLDWSQREGNRALLDWSSRTSWGEFTLAGSWRDKSQRSYFDQNGPEYRTVDLDVWGFTPRAKIAHGLAGMGLTTVVGMDVYRWDYRLKTSNAQANINRPIHTVGATQNTRALYAQTTAQISDRTTATLGARTERVSMDVSDVFDASAPGAFSDASQQGGQRQSLKAYEAGLRQQLTARSAVFGKVGRSYRYANVDEVFEYNATFSDLELQFLRPQIARTYETGYEWQVPRLLLRASVFEMNVRDEIHLDPFTAGVGNRNMPPSRRRGLELEGKWQAAQALTLRGSYTYTDARFDEGVLSGRVIADRTVPLVPRNKAYVGAAWALSEKTQLVGAVNYVGSRFMDNDEPNTLGVKMPSYAVADLKLVHRTRAWRVSAAVNNVTNEKYYTYAVRSTTSSNYNAYPLPERNYSVTAEYSFR